jgi:hypothetical protein
MPFRPILPPLTGSALKVPRVRSDERGFEYVSLGAGGEPVAIADVEGLADELAAKQAAGNYANAVHSHAEYAAANHVHAEYAAAAHNHAGVYAPVAHTQGYSSGGGAVTQLTSKSTGVTLHALCGRVTTFNTALAAAAEASFVVTNNQVAATDVVIVNLQSGGTPGNHLVSVSAVANGSFTVSISNLHTASLSIALVINFAVIKSVIA